MWGALVVVVIVVGVVVFVATRGGPGVGKGTGRSIKRGPASHYNIDGVAKKSYDTLDAARAVAQRQSQREKTEFAAYRCRDCGKFHVGHG